MPLKGMKTSQRREEKVKEKYQKGSTEDDFLHFFFKVFYDVVFQSAHFLEFGELGISIVDFVDEVQNLLIVFILRLYVYDLSFSVG
jgi:hypothetical protein